MDIKKKINQNSVCIRTTRQIQAQQHLFSSAKAWADSHGESLPEKRSYASLAHRFDSQLPFELPEWDWHTVTHNITSRLHRLNAKLKDLGRSERIQLETTSTGIIALTANP